VPPLRVSPISKFGGGGVFDEASPVATAFNSSFGVQFGSFVCFDIMYPHPALDVLQLPGGVKDVLFSSWWVNLAPTYNALMIQQAWSRVNGVNLIAANTGTGFLNAGGGIFAAGEPLQTSFNTSDFVGTSVLLVAKLEYPAAGAAGDIALFSHTASNKQPELAARLPDDVPTLVVTAAQLPTKRCFPNLSSLSLMNCTIFSVGDLATLAEEAGLPASGTRFILPPQYFFGDDVNLTCQSSLTLGNNIVAEDRYTLAVGAAVELFPYTPDPLSLQMCALQHCEKSDILSSPDGWVICLGWYNAFPTHVVQWSIDLSGVAFNAEVLPLLGVEDGQVISPRFSTYNDSMYDTAKLQGHDVREIHFSSAQSFNHSLFSATVLAVIPTTA
jgi:hypothetical protein